MIELQLMGTSVDGKDLVFRAPAEDEARYRVTVDETLFATLGDILERTETGMTDGAAPIPLHQAPEVAVNGSETAAPAPPAAPARPAAPAPPGAAGADGVRAHRQASPAPRSNLSPREIQALLRAGRSPRIVAKQAGTDEAWVCRWLPPIEAERSRIVAALQRVRLPAEPAAAGGDALGATVLRNLAARGVDVDDEQVRWTAARREGDATWSVTLHFRDGGRAQRSVWRFNPASGEAVPRNKLAIELGSTQQTRSAAVAAGGDGIVGRRERGSSLAAPGVATPRRR